MNAPWNAPRNALSERLGVLLVFAALAALASAGPTANKATTKRATLGAAEDTQCIQVQVVYRHGARTIVTPSYPTDPNKDPRLYQPYGIGHLTRLGRQMEYVLGQLLRTRYVGEGATVAKLLDEEYATGSISVKTSAVERTQESAAANLAGMWPPGSQQKWKSDNTQVGQQWFPIVYSIIPADQDRTIAGSAECPARDLEYNRVVTSEEFKKRLLRVMEGEDNLRYIEQNSGWTYNYSDPSFAAFPYAIFSSTQCQELLGMTVPAWTKKVYPEPLRSAAVLYLETLSYTPKLTRQAFGDLTMSILNATRNVETQPRFQAYSGHDGTVVALIQAFELEPDDDAGFGMPEFSACVMIELHQDRQGNRGLKFYYRRESGGKIITMIPKGCNAFCPLAQIEEILSNKLPDEGESCEVPADHGLLLRQVHRDHVYGHALPAA